MFQPDKQTLDSGFYLVAIVSSIPAMLNFSITISALTSNTTKYSWNRPQRCGMQNDASELDKMQTVYKAAVDEWIAAIKQEEALASVNHSVAEVDKWEAAHFTEDKIRSKVKAAKKKYEDALRERFFGF
jgi:hypothetical protein